jgi:hypothetical protein
MQGTLHPGVLPRILGELLIEGRTGFLRLSRDAQTLTLLVANERLAVVPLPSPARIPPALGPLANRLDAVLHELGVPPTKPPRRPGRTPSGREALIEALSWKDGSYSFLEQAPGAVAARDEAEQLRLPDAIRKAVGAIEGPEVLQEGLGDMDRVAALTAVARAAPLTPIDELVLARIDGSRTLRELTEQLALPAEDVQRSLFGLLCSGAIECRAKPAPPEVVGQSETPSAGGDVVGEVAYDEAAQARRREIQEATDAMRNRNHFEVLGIPRGADDLQVKEAYFRLARRFHPDLQRDPALADLKKECEALFMRIGDAYEVLRNPKSRARYEAELLSRESRPPSDLGGAAVGESPEALDTVQNALLADDAIRRAGELVVESQYWDAIQLLETTLPRIQSKRLQHEAQVLLARAYMRNPKWLRRGEELLQSVVREDPSWADAYFVLGTIYRSKGLKTRAVTMFRKVLELKPNHKPAAAEIRALGEAPPPAKQERRV